MTIKDIHELQERAYEHGYDDAIQGKSSRDNPYKAQDWTVRNAYLRGLADATGSESK